MNASSDEDRLDACLWDPAAPPSDEVRAIESTLAALRFDPAGRKVPIVERPPAAERLRPRRWLYGLAAAAVIVLVAGALLAQWRWRWPAGQPWTIASGPAAAPDRLAVGAPLLLSGADEARIDVARIGTLSVKNDARLTLQSTGGSRHRLVLDRGSVHVRVWAPPGSVHIQTPAGEVIDLGCEFELITGATGESVVTVQSGWVMITNDLGETLIPAGARSAMRRDRRPGVPVFLDASPTFTAAVRSLEASGSAGSLSDVDAIVGNARARDVLTLLVLVERRSPGSDRLARRAAELSPPPDGVLVRDVVAGDSTALGRWRDTLPLPPPKGWLRNWRDALPVWLRPGGR